MWDDDDDDDDDDDEDDDDDDDDDDDRGTRMRMRRTRKIIMRTNDGIVLMCCGYVTFQMHFDSYMTQQDSDNGIHFWFFHGLGKSTMIQP